MDEPIPEAELDGWISLAAEGIALHDAGDPEWTICAAVVRLIAEVRRLQARVEELEAELARRREGGG